mmetsp:Transcript_63916/g.164516  ORF Transcript_63916/g.164516 Transcript_63916/m.164516 type:complete len:248 (+) Transcript_63916:1037-1780(+)
MGARQPELLPLARWPRCGVLRGHEDRRQSARAPRRQGGVRRGLLRDVQLWRRRQGATQGGVRAGVPALLLRRAQCEPGWADALLPGLGAGRARRHLLVEHPREGRAGGARGDDRGLDERGHAHRSRRHQPPGAREVPHRRRGHILRVLLRARECLVPRTGEHEAAAAGEGPRRTDGLRQVLAERRHPVLDQPRLRGARRGLSRQHGLRPGLPGQAQGSVGRGGHRGRLCGRDVSGEEGPRGPGAAGH